MHDLGHPARHPATDADSACNPDWRSVLFVSTCDGELGHRLLDEARAEVKELKPFGEKRVRCKDPDWR